MHYYPLILLLNICIDVVPLCAEYLPSRNVKQTMRAFLFIGFSQFFYSFSVIGSDFGVLGHLWSQNDVNMSWLRVEADSYLKLLPTSILVMNKISWLRL
jgi:hypothetical protein